MVNNWFEPKTTLGKLQQKSWTPRRPESHPGNLEPCNQRPGAQTQRPSPRITPRRPSALAKHPVLMPSARHPCLGVGTAPKLRKKVSDTRLGAGINAYAGIDLRVLLDPPFLEGTIPTHKWYFLIRCTCQIISKRFAASSFWRRCRG
ncbi:hypothetical protein PIB30_058511 [Stylosanthes scabra]|uniref:Uncharacterized protein n=1 Tax=Stylosanthes scabra TaxID=79078 RepID=A0ABU6VK95_9FABA|nr:hypothetical protein [Stylosanthes scabra]